MRGYIWIVISLVSIYLIIYLIFIVGLGYGHFLFPDSFLANELPTDLSYLGKIGNDKVIVAADDEKPLSGVCLKQNGCNRRTLGSGYACNSIGYYEESGMFWCECTPECEVKIS